MRRKISLVIAIWMIMFSFSGSAFAAIVNNNTPGATETIEQTNMDELFSLALPQDAIQTAEVIEPIDDDPNDPNPIGHETFGPEFYYRQVEGGVYVNRYRLGILPNQTIPSNTGNDVEWLNKLLNQPILGVDDNALKDNKFCETMTIADSVIHLGNGVFSGCSALKSITLGNYVPSIGYDFCKDCVALTSINLPSTLTAIGNSAFENCSSLPSITIPDSVQDLGEATFYNCSSLHNVTLGNGISEIGDYVFNGCESLASIVIPGTVTNLGTGAFWGCSALNTINIPSSVTTIGNGAFYHCSSLTQMSLPKSVTAIGDYAFEGCTNLSKITVLDTVTSIGDTTFKDCSNLTIYGIIGSYAESYAQQHNIPFRSISGGFTTDLPSPQKVGTDIILTAVGGDFGVAPFEYQFYYTLNGATILIRDYSSVNSATFTPPEAGTYNLYVKFRDANYATHTLSIENYVIEQATVSNLECYYRTHVQNIGWQEQKGNGQLSGTTGLSYRLEAIQMVGWDPVNQEEVNMYYQTHVQNIGWQDWKNNKAVSGTSGLGLRLEAIRILLPDSVAYDYDVYYQVHAQNFGWLDWARNGQSSGTAGFGYRLEGIRILILPKGSPAPGPTSTPFVQKY